MSYLRLSPKNKGGQRMIGLCKYIMDGCTTRKLNVDHVNMMQKIRNLYIYQTYKHIKGFRFICVTQKLTRPYI